MAITDVNFANIPCGINMTGGYRHVIKGGSFNWNPVDSLNAVKATNSNFDAYYAAFYGPINFFVNKVIINAKPEKSYNAVTGQVKNSFSGFTISNTDDNGLNSGIQGVKIINDHIAHSNSYLLSDWEYDFNGIKASGTTTNMTAKCIFFDKVRTALLVNGSKVKNIFSNQFVDYNPSGFPFIDTSSKIYSAPGVNDLYSACYKVQLPTFFGNVTTFDANPNMTNYDCITPLTGCGWFPDDKPNSIKSVSDKTQLEIYPNPVSNSFTIKYNGNIVSARLINNAGQTLFLKPLNFIDNSKFEFDLSNVSNGLYILEVIDNKSNTYYAKLVKN